MARDGEEEEEDKGEKAGEKGKRLRILIHNRCSLTSRGNEVENRTLPGSTHLFFTFHEDTNVGFRAPLRFSRYYERVRITERVLEATEREKIAPNRRRKKKSAALASRFPRSAAGGKTATRKRTSAIFGKREAGGFINGGRNTILEEK